MSSIGNLFITDQYSYKNLLFTKCSKHALNFKKTPKNAISRSINQGKLCVSFLDTLNVEMINYSTYYTYMWISQFLRELVSCSLPFFRMVGLYINTPCPILKYVDCCAPQFLDLFMLEKMFQRNASNFALFFTIFISCCFISNFSSSINPEIGMSGVILRLESVEASINTDFTPPLKVEIFPKNDHKCKIGWQTWKGKPLFCQICFRFWFDNGVEIHVHHFIVSGLICNAKRNFLISLIWQSNLKAVDQSQCLVYP